MTDEKLAQIKAALVLSIAEYGNQDAKDMLDIIERLAAAESLIKETDDNGITDKAISLHDAWLAACGKVAKPLCPRPEFDWPIDGWNDAD